MCGSTYFGRLTAHHQEHRTALGAGDILPDRDQQRVSRFYTTVKQEAVNAV
jgi:hypothetical protein